MAAPIDVNVVFPTNVDTRHPVQGDEDAIPLTHFRINFADEIPLLADPREHSSLKFWVSMILTHSFFRNFNF